MILILAPAEDPHAWAVTKKLRERKRVVRRFDLSEFGRGATISYRPGIEDQVQIRPLEGDVIRLGDVRSVWARRPGTPEISPSITDPQDRRFAAREWNHALDGLWPTIPAKLVNPPRAQRLAIKPWQLIAARQAGLRIPATLITSDPVEAELFIDEHNGRVIHKSMTAPEHTFVDTRRWSDETRRHLSDLPLAPTIFQEEIQGPADVRVTVVGNTLLAAKIHTAAGRAEIDSRLDLDAPCEPHTLPASIDNALLRLMDRLGLLFATIDLKIADDGGYVFLETNPQGQFLYIEILTGLPITAALAKLLDV